MTKPCAVPNCSTRHEKRSVFRVPSNVEQYKKWVAAIPGATHLKQSQFVCEKHFEQRFILRKWIKHDSNGRIVAEASYVCPRLDPSAVPSIFDSRKDHFTTDPSSSNSKCAVTEHNYCSSKDSTIQPSTIAINDVFVKQNFATAECGTTVEATATTTGQPASATSAEDCSAIQCVDVETDKQLVQMSEADKLAKEAKDLQHDDSSDALVDPSLAARPWWLQSDLSCETLSKPPPPTSFQHLHSVYKYPQLKKCAVPTKFGDVGRGKENWDHSYAKPLPDWDDESVAAENPWNISDRSSGRAKPSTDSIGTPVGRTRLPATGVNIGRRMSMTLSPIEIWSNESTVSDSLPQELVKENSPLRIGKQIPEENATTTDDFSAHVPDSWSWVKMRTKIVHHTLFTYSITKIRNGEHCPVSQKNVTLDADGTLKYFVYGRRVDPRDKNLRQTLTDKEMLKDVLTKFRGTNVCMGMGDVDTFLLPVDEVYQDYVDNWRSSDCPLLSREKRCSFCVKCRASTFRRAARLKEPSFMQRITAVSNPIDQLKLSAMRLKLRCVGRQKRRAKQSVERLVERLKEQEEQIASMRDADSRKKFVELEFSDSGKLTIQRVVAAVNKQQNETLAISRSERLENK